eukprot:1108939-Amphidinium_carterae.2
MQATDIEIIIWESLVSDHKANGAAAVVIRRLKDMARTRVLGVENRLGGSVPDKHGLVLFAVASTNTLLLQSRRLQSSGLEGLGSMAWLLLANECWACQWNLTEVRRKT